MANNLFCDKATFFNRLDQDCMQKLLLRVAASPSSLPPSLVLLGFFFPFPQVGQPAGFSSPSSFHPNAKAEEVGAGREKAGTKAAPATSDTRRKETIVWRLICLLGQFTKQL
jgi:hypothetical protein